QKAELAKVSIPGQIIIGRHRLSHKREVPVIPREPARLDHHATHGGTVPTQKLRSRVNNNIGPMIQGTDQIRRRQRGIHNQRDAMFGGKLTKTLQIHNHTRRIRHDLGIDGLSIWLNRGGKILHLGGIHKRSIHTKSTQRDIKLSYRTTIKLRRSYEVVTGTSQGSDRHKLGRLTRSRSNRTNTTF